MKPLFIFSLPRSGSTLLQRIIAADKRISSVSEPWLLLPFVYALKRQGVKAEYDHELASIGINDFLSELPQGKSDYLFAISSAILTLYEKASGNNNLDYFLDKTPRYSLISGEIIEMFPDGKFIFLWRNPIAIIASMIETWGEGNWNIDQYYVDLFNGMANLIDSNALHSGVVMAVQYERFLQFPEVELERISRYLNLDLDLSVLSVFSKVRFNGSLGDPTGIKTYKSLDQEPIHKWKTVINNPFRKRFCRKYLHWLGEERLKQIGYDYIELLDEINSIQNSYKYFFSDIFGYLRYKTRARFKRLLLA